MRIFIGFGYNDRDRWVPEFVFPIVRAFGHEIETGEDLVGQPIDAGVGGRIDRSHALIGFLTRRDPLAGGQRWTTHRWVSDELAHAARAGHLIMEVREAGVDEQGGIVGGRQHLRYEEESRERFLVEFVEALGNWPRGSVRLQLQSDDPRQLVPLLRRPDFKCQYRFNIEGEETDPQEAELQAITGGLFVDIKNVPPKGLVQVEIQYQDRIWVTAFESMENHKIELFQG